MKTLEELKTIRDQLKDQIGFRNSDSLNTRIVVGMATCGIASGAKPVIQAINDSIKNNGLENIEVTQTGCIGLCQYEPIVEIYEPGNEKVTYINMTAEKAMEVVQKHLLNGNVVEKYTISSINNKEDKQCIAHTF